MGIGSPTDSDAGVVYVAKSNGNGFPGWTWKTTGRMIGTGAGVLLGDVDGDGKADLVGIGSPKDPDAGVVYVAKSDGSGFPAWTWKTAGRMIGDGAGVLLGDVDGDGKADLVGIGSPKDPDAGVVYVAKSNGSGFPAWTWQTAGRMIGDGAGVLLGDVDGDRKADLVGIGSPKDPDAGVVYVAKSNGSGFPGWAWKTTSRMMSDTARALIGDVTGDRKNDLVGVGSPVDADAGVVYMAPSTGTQFSSWTWWSGR